MLKTLALALSLGALLHSIALAQETRLTARQVVERIQKNVGVTWHSQTVDSFKAGDPDTPVTGIATTMMGTYDVLQRAAAAGDNLIVTHEPVFYNHLDQTAVLEKEGDAVLAAKKALIEKNHLVICASTTSGMPTIPTASRPV